MYHITPFYPVPNHLYPSNESICGTLISSNLSIYTTSREQTNTRPHAPLHSKTKQYYSNIKSQLTTLRNPITTVTIKYSLLIRINIIWITCKMCGRYAIVTLDIFATVCVWTL